MIPGSANPLLLGQTDSDYQIERSLRFNSGDDAYLSRQPSSAGNRKTWTWSGWVKRSKLGGNQSLFSAAYPANETLLIFDNSNRLVFWNFVSGSYAGQKTSTAVFRDCSAWYHITLVWDSGNSTAADRIKIYVNGARIDTFSTSVDPAQNTESIVNDVRAHRIGDYSENASYNLGGYLADVHLIDGQALVPSDFGETDDNGVWQPKKFNGKYGPLVNQSQTWSTTITTSTLANTDPAYYAKLYSGNPSNNNGVMGVGGNAGSSFTLTIPASVVGSTISVTSVYSMSFQVNGGASNVMDTTVSLPSGIRTITITGTGGNSGTASGVYIDGKLLVDSGVSVADNSFHLDFADNSSNAALGTDTSGNGNTWTVNNLNAAAAGLATANQGFDVITYTGTGSTRSIGGLSFAPDFVWIKGRSTGSNTIQHVLQDTVRGTNSLLTSNANYKEADLGTHWGYISSFNSDGFTLTPGAGGPDHNNYNNLPYVAWCWKAGGAASSNTYGTIISSVSANNTYGFSVVSFTDGGSACTVGHGLSIAPKMIIAKFRGAAGNWSVYHEAIGNDHRLKLNLVDVKQSGNDWWNATSPTSSVFSLGSNLVANTTQIAYCWSEIPGFSKISSYAGSNSSQTIECGFEPAFVIIKCTTSGNDWIVQDNARGIEVLRPNLANAEFGGNYVSFTSTGFTLNTSDGRSNSSGDTYIYAAFATKPDQSVIDSLVDTPTNEATPTDTGAGGEVVGNYATFNPLDKTSGITLSDGNLKATGQANGSDRVRGTIAIPRSGKWYFEFTLGSAFYGYIGISNIDGTKLVGRNEDGRKYTEAGHVSTPFASITAGDIVGVALDNNTTLTFYKNGVAESTTVSVDSNTDYFAMANFYNAIYILNCGQRAFDYPVSGYKSLNTASLPTPTIADGSQYFDVALWTGNNSTQSLTGFNFGPDLFWSKSRSTTWNNGFHDIVRGTNKLLRGDTTGAEYTAASPNESITSFNADGVTFGADGAAATVNYSGTYVGWAWDAGTSTVSNTDGTITSQVRANPSAGFSIVSYTGGSANSTVGHGLGAAPYLIICKSRNQGSAGWDVYHRSLGKDKFLILNENYAEGVYSNHWGTSEPNSTVFGVSQQNYFNNHGDMIAYCFAPVAGYSAMGSYTGDQTSYPFVFTGFKPAWLLLKAASRTGDWILVDAKRNTSNVVNYYLYPNSSGAESTYPIVDFLSNGFKLQYSGGLLNENSQTYAYLAFASHPFASNGGLAR